MMPKNRNKRQFSFFASIDAKKSLVEGRNNDESF